MIMNLPVLLSGEYLPYIFLVLLSIAVIEALISFLAIEERILFVF